MPLARLALLAALVGCAATDGATAALAAATTAMKAITTVRRHVCARELDPLLGDPRAPMDAGAPPLDAAAPQPVADAGEVE